MKEDTFKQDLMCDDDDDDDDDDERWETDGRVVWVCAWGIVQCICM